MRPKSSAPRTHQVRADLALDHSRHGKQHRDRDHEGRDQCGAKIPEQQEKHEDNKEGALSQILGHCLNGCVHKERSVQNRLGLDRWRQRFVDLLHLGIDHCRYAAAVASDQHECRADDSLLAVFAGASCAQLAADLHLGEVLHPYGHAAACCNNDIADLVHALQAPGGADGIGFTIVFDVTRAAIKIIVLDRRGDVTERQVEPDKFGRIWLDVILLSENRRASRRRLSQERF